jgi:hypothetical protein
MKQLTMTKAALLAALLIAGGAYAQQPPTAPPKAVDPDAVKALERMGAYLRTLKAFQIKAATTDEDVLDDGQKIQYDGTVDVLVRVPDGLRAEVANERRDRQLLFNGRVATVFARRSNMYATVAAPPTIRELADKLENDYGMEVPLVDLFRWGSPGGSSGADLTAAADIGPAVVAGTTCRHYAYRQSGTDWQLWIQQGDYPLPRKLVITTMTDEARPQHSVVYTWNLAPSFNEAAFVFDPPEGVQKVVLTRAKPADGAPADEAKTKSEATSKDDTGTPDDTRK